MVALRPLRAAVLVGGLWLTGLSALAQEGEGALRFANGRPVKGTFVAAQAAGIVVQTDRNRVTIPWGHLSPATRFRLQRDEYKIDTTGVVKEAPREVVEVAPGEAAPPEAMGLFEYERPADRMGEDLPAGPLRTPDWAAYCAFQFGPKASDVAYLAFDCPKPDTLHDEVYVCVPGHPMYGRGFKINGRRSRGVVKFGKFKLESFVADIHIGYEVELANAGKGIDVVIDCGMTREGRLHRCLLTGRWEYVMDRRRSIIVERVLQPPSASFSLDHRSDPAQIFGRIKMGRLLLYPGTQMSDKVEFTVVDAAGKTIDDRKIRLAKSDAGEFRFPPKRLDKGVDYTASIRVDLGSILGVHTSEEKIKD